MFCAQRCSMRLYKDGNIDQKTGVTQIAAQKILFPQ